MAQQLRFLRIVEEDRGALHAIVQTPMGEVTVMANVTKEPHRLILSRVHTEGKGLTRAIIRRAAKEVGEREGVAEVLLQGGVRTSGANPGSTPTPILVKVNL